MKKVVFCADVFADQLGGGAELHDHVLIEYIKSQGLLHDTKKAAYIEPEYLEKNLDKIWIFANFSQLPTWAINRFIEKGEYILYEHDYKFLVNRNPAIFPNFIAPDNYFHNVNFYKSAKKVICLSKLQRSIYEKNLDLSNLDNMHCSMWSDEDLQYIREISTTPKVEKYAVIDSPNPLKKTKETIKYCEDNNLSYELISSPDYYSFLRTLSNYKGLIIITGAVESTPRIALEAKMLNCKVIAQKNLISVAHEDYFHLEGNDMIEKVRELRDAACAKIKSIIMD